MNERKTIINCYVDKELKQKIIEGASRNKISQAAFLNMTLANALLNKNPADVGGNEKIESA